MTNSNQAYLESVSTKISGKQLLMNRNTSPNRPLSDEDLMVAVLNTPFNQYPEEEETKFIQAYATYNGLNPQQLALANGSDEWLQKLVIQFGKAGVLALETDFFMYGDYTRQLEYSFYTVACDENFNYNLEQIIESLDQYKPSLFFISNPQNPTGRQFSSQFLQDIADECQDRNVVFVIDEAYIEFGETYDRPENENVIYVRTLSKIYGVAGLRIGIAIGQGQIFEKLLQINHPYPVNSVSLNIASKLFEDTEKLDLWIDTQKHLKNQLVSAFDTVSDVIKVVPSQTNYVFMYGDELPNLVEYLSDKGYVGRTYAGGKMTKVARYSIIDDNDYSRLERDIKEWRKQIED